MSVQLLSSRDVEPDRDGTVPYGATDHAKPGAVDNNALDNVVDAALDAHYREEDPAPDSRDLDTIIGTAMDAAENREADAESFKASREARTELQDRYGSQGNLGDTLNAFIGWAQAFKQDPQGAGQRFAESYLKASPYALTDRAEKPKAETYVDGGGFRHTGRELDQILEDAIDSASEEKQQFVATAAQREALAQVFPGVSFDEAMRKVVAIDRDAIRDPLTTAATLAASFGMPVLPHQQQEAAAHNHVLAHVDAAAAQGMDADRVMNVVNHPEFVKSGDPVADLHRARAVADRLQQQEVELSHYVDQQQAAMTPEMNAMVEKVVLGRDPHYLAEATRIANSRPFGDPQIGVLNLEVARQIASQRLGALSKAKRAGRVRTSSGHQSRGSSSERDLDAIVGNALAGWGD